MIEVLSIDEELLQELRQGVRGTVHSVHCLAVYLRDLRGICCCITVSDSANGPQIVRLDQSGFEQLAGCLRQGDLFFAGPSFIRLGSAQLSCSHAKLWNIDLPVFPPENCLAETLISLKRILADYGSGGLKHLFNQTTAQDIISAELSRRAKNLLNNLKQRRFSELEADGLALLGLGSGLTPSGDDFLAALITLFNLPQGPFPTKCREIGRSWAVAAEHATTSVGTFLLQIAAQGRAREPICKLLAEIKSGSSTIEQNARAVLQFGSSSGTDWLAGLTAGMEAGLALYQWKGEENGGFSRSEKELLP